MTMIKKKVAVATGPVDCVSGAPNIGDKCIGGGVYLGTYTYPSIGTKKLMVTDGGCNNSATPTCPGTVDTLTLVWGTFNVTTGATDADDGNANTNSIVGADTGAAAAKFCSNMVYAGFSDWYLPSQNELNVLYTNSTAVGSLSLTTTGYWTSGEASAFSGWGQRFDSGSQLGNAKTLSEYVRCMRRY